MSSYFRYHTQSGHVDSKFTVMEESIISSYDKDGYAFIPTEEPFGAVYITNNVITKREHFNGGEGISAAIGEPITISNLPIDSWVKIDNDDPIPVGNDGSVEVASHDEPTLVELVGKYTSRAWMLTWKPLAELKESMKEKIDIDAETERSKISTPGAGQAVTYLRKADAARLYLAGSTISAAQMQRLEDEAEITGLSIHDAAQGLVNSADAWELADAKIDHVRLITKKAIDDAITGTEVYNIVKSINWTL